MKNTTYMKLRIVLSIFIMALITSCGENFFDTEIGGRIDPTDHYRSLRDAESSRDGCFVFLQEIAEKRVIVDGLLSDQMAVTENADRNMIDIYRHDLSANNPYIDPSGYYKMIVNINEVLPNLPQIVNLDRDFDSTTLVQYTGTLVTLRSWAYFNLARLNGEVGLIEDNLTSVDPSQPPRYLSKTQIIDYLIEELLPYYDEDDIFRYDIDLYILLGELYLEKNDYANAKKYLKFACDGPGIGTRVYMVTGEYGEEGWQDIFLNSADQTTTVFYAVPYSFVDGQKNMLEEWMHINYDYMVKPTDLLINAFKNEIPLGLDPVPGDVFRGVGITYDTTTDGSPYITKYSQDIGIPHSADVILYRAADVHLLLAEALNRLGQTEIALALLNKGIADFGTRPPDFPRWGSNSGVRGRVQLSDRVVPGDTPDPITYLEDLIIQERAEELAFEGKRWFDLVRIATRRGDPAYLANKVASKYEDPDLAESVRDKLMDPANWYLPIPKVE